ncbi:DUF6686 family protein [Zunongwangia endophytica]|uniref:DUF6686 family protein n=1 Tax=Zunongwangia endophytica TaxID=1808945 RepID=A0ABV8H6B8_9FLAO|nr:DUF6686 family protein [Zunongwangia endophytica]MDN3596037.1 hypothetical protein [Zunongwangia endophytica]
MEDVDIIYHNNTGISFKWKSGIANAGEKRIQLVFKDMGFYLSPEEVNVFSKNIRVAKNNKTNCKQCPHSELCERKILLKSPLKKMDFVVNAFELNEICDLVEGTIFKMKLHNYVELVSRN